MNAKFDAILQMEKNVKITRVAEMFGTPGQRDSAARAGWEAKRKLYAAIDALTDEEMEAFGEYRKSHGSE